MLARTVAALAVLVWCADWANAELRATGVLNTVFRKKAFGKKYTTTETDPVLNAPTWNRETVADEQTDLNDGSDLCTAFVGQTGIHLTGVAINDNDVKNPFDCASLCYRDPNCKAWQMEYNSGRCEHYETVTSIKVSYNYINWIKGDRTKAQLEETDYRRVYEMNLGYKFTGKVDDGPFRTEEPIQCATRCAYNPRCYAYQLEYSTNRCEVFYYYPESVPSKDYLYAIYQR